MVYTNNVYAQVGASGRRRQGAPKPTPTVEDYLALLYVLDRDKTPIVGAQVAEMLRVSAPTVTATLQRMSRAGWVKIDARKGAMLTPLGRDEARSVIQRHMLSEWILNRVLDVAWSDIHAEAHRLEHGVSEDVAARMRKRMQDPEVCPHGNPLPGHESRTEGWIALDQAPVGIRVVIRRVHELAEYDTELLKFLEEKGVLPGVKAIVREMSRANQTVTLEIKGERVTLGWRIAGQIFVEPAAGA
ncbi:MAG: metal-dependent transcriptional regulator [Candidatus Roseilinea sp.]|uniref:metal-dependent transcriptional regulator n=1 Tax=Candidatus Roseilinea sp. TaxID=2838777 RepID=UPI00404B3E51